MKVSEKKGGNQNREIIPLCTLWENVMSSLTGIIAEIIETCIRAHDIFCIWYTKRQTGTETYFFWINNFTDFFDILECGFAKPFTDVWHLEAYLWATNIGKPVQLTNGTPYGCLFLIGDISIGIANLLPSSKYWLNTFSACILVEFIGKIIILF